MNRQEYEEYQTIFQSTWNEYNLTHLSQQYTPEEELNNEDLDICPWCEEEIQGEPYFSWRSCEVCHSPLGGDRYHVNGINSKTNEVICFEACPDCVYYAEYGQLDDMTMMEIDTLEAEAQFQSGTIYTD